MTADMDIDHPQAQAYVARYEQEHGQLHEEHRDNMVLMLSVLFQDYGEPSQWPKGEGEEIIAAVTSYNPDERDAQAKTDAGKWHQKIATPLILGLMLGLVMMAMGLEETPGLFRPGIWVMCFTGIGVSLLISKLDPTAPRLQTMTFVASLGLLGTYLVLYTYVDYHLILLSTPGFTSATVLGFIATRQAKIVSKKSWRTVIDKTSPAAGFAALTIMAAVTTVTCIVAGFNLM